MGDLNILSQSHHAPSGRRPTLLVDYGKTLSRRHLDVEPPQNRNKSFSARHLFPTERLYQTLEERAPTVRASEVTFSIKRVSLNSEGYEDLSETYHDDSFHGDFGTMDESHHTVAVPSSISARRNDLKISLATRRSQSMRNLNTAPVQLTPSRLTKTTSKRTVLTDPEFDMFNQGFSDLNEGFMKDESHRRSSHRPSLSARRTPSKSKIVNHTTSKNMETFHQGLSDLNESLTMDESFRRRSSSKRQSSIRSLADDIGESPMTLLLDSTNFQHNSLSSLFPVQEVRPSTRRSSSMRNLERDHSNPGKFGVDRKAAASKKKKKKSKGVIIDPSELAALEALMQVGKKTTTKVPPSPGARHSTPKTSRKRREKRDSEMPTLDSMSEDESPKKKGPPSTRRLPAKLAAPGA